MTRTNRRLTTSGKDREDMKFPLLSIFVEPASRKDHGGGNPELVNILAFVFAAFMVFGNSLRISDPTIVEEGYQDLVKHIDRKPYPFIEGLQNIQRLMKTHYPKLAEIRVEGLIESRFIRKLDESGFIDRLYKSYGVK
jgi:hypothetical protein